MKNRLLVIALLLLPSTLIAQVGPVTVRMAPAPNQTLRIRTLQETVVTVEPDRLSGSKLPIPAMTINMTIAMEHTSTVGPTDAQGRYESRMVVDHTTSTMTMNGQPSPVQMPMEKIAGTAMTFVYDSDGKVVDVRTEGDLLASAAVPLQDMLKSVVAAAPVMTLSVGESTTIPAHMNMALPGVGAMGITGETTYTLTSVSFEGSDRIAHLTMTMSGTVNHGAPTGGAGPQMAMDMQMSSEGKTDVNIDRGIVLHTEQVMNIEGTMHLDGASPSMPAMRMHGTTKTSGDVY
jgi:hypothetical protein